VRPLMEIRLDEGTIKLIALFESVTRAEVRDCIPSDEKIVFIVGKGQAGAAIGERGDNIHRLRDMLRKNVEVIEWADQPEAFVRNIFHAFNVSEVKIEKRSGRNTAVVTVDPGEKARAIGKQGRNLHQAKAILARHYKDIEAVLIA
jgi:N utilization substance protein A